LSVEHLLRTSAATNIQYSIFNAQYSIIKTVNMIPGEYILLKTDIIANEGRTTATVQVINTGDRPVQVGSHFHFFEVNKQMSFNRSMAYGMRLNIPAGTAVRFEPGEEKQVELVAFGGHQKVVGFNNLVNGAITDDNKQPAIDKALAGNFKNKTT
jgi:urease beta subunit